MNDNNFFCCFLYILLKVSIDIVRVAHKNIVLFFFLQLFSPDHFCPRIICTESQTPLCAHRFFFTTHFPPSNQSQIQRFPSIKINIKKFAEKKIVLSPFLFLSLHSIYFCTINLLENSGIGNGGRSRPTEPNFIHI